MDTTFTASHHRGSGSPLVCIHGFTDTWRTWELMLPELERHHEVLAPTLAGHAGGPVISGPIDHNVLVDALERAMDDAGFETAHIVGNSLGGFVALQLAARGRARTVVALAPAGGWPQRDPLAIEALDRHEKLQELVGGAAPHADAIVASEEGRRRATEYTTASFAHIPAELLAHQIRGAASCDAALPLLDFARREGYSLDAQQITCPVRIVWGTEDRLLPWPRAATRYREEWLPQADWVELDGVGHSPQLDVPVETGQLILGFTNA
jgi:pimeloyl-ACP methyl ester carboxylesterase